MKTLKEYREDLEYWLYRSALLDFQDNFNSFMLVLILILFSEILQGIIFGLFDIKNGYAIFGISLVTVIIAITMYERYRNAGFKNYLLMRGKISDIEQR